MKIYSFLKGQNELRRFLGRGKRPKVSCTRGLTHTHYAEGPTAVFQGKESLLAGARFFWFLERGDFAPRGPNSNGAPIKVLNPWRQTFPILEEITQNQKSNNATP